ncbi:MAG: oligosaccharide flippase family protein [Methylobacteriaceae bacterium]|nr:oligosaccharide flippase family protein [Methylobacteriaceae bacterium]
MSLRKQAACLAIIHGADTLQPLLILPYAGRVLGPIDFGQYAYAMSIGQLATTIVGYGFHWTAQRAAASARGDPAAIASIFAEVVTAKAILCVLVTLAGLAAADSLIAVSKPMFLCTMLTPLGDILFPAWLFVALERVWQAAIAVVTARALALLLFLTLVSSSDQLGLAVAIQAAIPVVSGAVSLPFIVHIALGGFKSVTLSRVGTLLKSGWHGFLFTLVETALMVLPIPLVTHFAGFAAAGQYSVADKFVGATRPVFRVMSETFLPRVAYYARHDPAAGIALIWRSLSTLIVGASLSLSLFFLAPYFIIYFFGEGFSEAIPIVRIMSVIPVLTNINICMSNLYMFNYGHERMWAILTVSGLLTFLVFAYLLSYLLPNAGIAVALAVITRLSLVLGVSVGFFLTFGVAKMRLPAVHNVGASRGAVIVADSMIASPVRPLRLWRSRSGSER